DAGPHWRAPMSTPFPSIPIRRFRLDFNENKAVSESLFSRKRQSVSLGAGTSDRWEGLIETPRLSPDDVRTLFGWAVAVGLYGEFTIADPDYPGAASGE